MTGRQVFVLSFAVYTALPGLAQAQGRDSCIYANASYSHGAIFAGTRCNNGTWINLSEMEFRRLYPNGLEAAAGASAAAAGAAAAARPAPNGQGAAPDGQGAAPNGQGAPPDAGAPEGQTPQQ